MVKRIQITNMGGSYRIVDINQEGKECSEAIMWQKKSEVVDFIIDNM